MRFFFQQYYVYIWSMDILFLICVTYVRVLRCPHDPQILNISMWNPAKFRFWVTVRGLIRVFCRDHLDIILNTVHNTDIIFEFPWSFPICALALPLADDQCAPSPGDELGLCPESAGEVFPGSRPDLCSVTLHVFTVAIVEAADKLQHGDRAVLAHVKPVKHALRRGCGHLEQRTDGEELPSFDPPRIVHVVGVKERA